jgi:hypothetical protein
MQNKVLLDYAGPAQFEPAARPRGVGEHPHRGFHSPDFTRQGVIAGKFGRMPPPAAVGAEADAEA